MGMDYETVGQFYEALSANLAAFVSQVGESTAFCGNPLLQLSSAEIDLTGAQPVICAKTALAAFKAIVEQGEGAPKDSAHSHFQRFIEVRSELRALKEANPDFTPAFPAAHNPVLRPPVRREGRVWLENEEAIATVDLANACYALMLRLVAYSYVLLRPIPEKLLAIDLAMGLMRAVTLLGERAARLPAGPSNPDCNAGMSFTSLRDAAPLLPGSSASQFFVERLAMLAEAAAALATNGDKRVSAASRQLLDLSQRAASELEGMSNVPQPISTPQNIEIIPIVVPTPTPTAGLEISEGEKLTILFEGKKCIHSRFCVTGAPNVFLANVEGPWIHPNAMDAESLVAIAHECPSGAIRYKRKDGNADETPSPVNLISIREAGPYAVRGDIRLAGESGNFRLTLCRCGASKNKPYCDSSHHDVGFSATGEPPSRETEMLPVRDGPLTIEPQTNGPLQMKGNLEITSGTGRVVARVTHARLCRCGASNAKPFCDGSHARIGFRSDI